MERILLFGSLLIGGLVWLLGSLRPAGSTRSLSSPTPWKTPLGTIALVLPFLGFLLSLPASKPLFSAGHGLGTGFLLGGVAALLAAWSAVRQRGAGSSSASIGIACAVSVLPLLFLRASIIDALLGIAIGWFAVTFPLYLAVRPDDNAEEGSTVSHVLAAGAGFTAALCGVAALGIWRDALTPALARTTWSATAILFASVGALLALAARLVFPGEKVSAAKEMIPALVFAAVGAVVMKFFSVKVAPEPRLFMVALAGLLVWPAAAWLLRDAEERDSARNPSSPLGLPPLAVLLIAAGFVASYQMLQGFGAGVYVLTLFLSHALSPRRAGAVPLLLFATTLILYRVFAARFGDDLRGVTLTDQYALFGLIFGALLPGLLASLVGRRSTVGAGGTLALILAGTLALAIPAAVVLLFGGKSALALLLGLGLGSIQMVRGAAVTTPAFSALPGLFSLAMSLALTQFTGKILPLTEMTRLHKIQILECLIAGVVTVLLLAKAAALSPRSTADGEAQ